MTKYRKAVAEEDAERMAAESSGKLGEFLILVFKFLLIISIGSTVSGTITPEAERLDIASSLASKLGESHLLSTFHFHSLTLHRFLSAICPCRRPPSSFAEFHRSQIGCSTW